ncbi:hypothetical protein FGRMN_10876 [Fusarium graminum]|nr:hypothetical protein FGRMN_10876 [Fusarium graminum]
MSSFDRTNTTNGRATAVRRKASEACGRCREKRIKCNGLQPCEQCIKKDVQCVFAFSLSPQACGTEAIVERLDRILSRLDKIEEEQSRQACILASYSGPDAKRPRDLRRRRSSGIAQLNQETGCFEYYGQFDANPSNVIILISSNSGQTSTFNIASCLGKRLRQLEDYTNDDSVIQPPTRRRNNSDPEHEASGGKGSKDLILDEIPGFCDYVVPLNAPRSDRYLLEKVADRHISNFFTTIHFLLPILTPAAFRNRYKALRQLFGDRRLSLPTLDDPTRPQFVCLMYAVLALGALYEDEQDDSSSWASWYFAEAQDILGRLVNASNLELVQASTLLGAYAQHAIKPNLAYIFNGLATRLAFSNGLNIESLHGSLGIDTQEARRTWWMIYIQEVELSLDSGRPMCLGSSQMDMRYPKTHIPTGGEIVPEPSQAMFIPLLADLIKIIRKIIDLSRVSPEESNFRSEQIGELLSELHSWRASLPQHLAFEDEKQYTIHHNCDKDTSNSLYVWESRQESSLRIPTLLILFRVVDGQHGSRRCRREKSNDSMSLKRVDHETIEDDEYLCYLAVEVFDLIKLKASQRCADVVRCFLDKWGAERTMNDKDAPRTDNTRPTNFEMQQAPPPAVEFPFPVEHSSSLDNEHWNSLSVESVESSDSTSSSISLGGLQEELHQAFYHNLDNDLSFSQQPPLISIEDFSAFILEISPDDAVEY